MNPIQKAEIVEQDFLISTCSENEIKEYYQTASGTIYLGNSLHFLNNLNSHSINLIVTSPPFGLVRKKEYGNVDADLYVEWFEPFGEAFRRVLRPNGSLVIDIGGAWNSGIPTRSLYHYELLIMLCRKMGFHLAQEFFWWNPAKLPTPAEWVTVRRIRVKDAVNCIWWLSPTPWPSVSNRRNLTPYSDSMKVLLKNGYKPKMRPSGHDISDKFSVDNGAAIPPNLIAIPNTESNSQYLHYCRQNNLEPHPARFPSELPEYFIRMLTDPGDLVLDPFAGSCVVGEVAEKLKRKWVCVEIVEDYLKGALARFCPQQTESWQKELFPKDSKKGPDLSYYKIPHPGLLWGSLPSDSPLPKDGGQTRPAKNTRS